MIITEKGMKKDCHFLMKTGKRIKCAALRDFYNCENPNEQCLNCPFYKTDEEFFKGWNNRSINADTGIFEKALCY